MGGNDLSEFVAPRCLVCVPAKRDRRLGRNFEQKAAKASKKSLLLRSAFPFCELGETQKGVSQMHRSSSKLLKPNPQTDPERLSPSTSQTSPIFLHIAIRLADCKIEVFKLAINL
jgi:hypothetical protein